MHMTLSRGRRGQQRGLSLIELMVGIAVGLFIVAGASKLLVDNLVNNRRLLVETRVNQDLRVAADLMARDLRRAGYWQNAERGVYYKNGPTAVTVNQYAAASSAPSASEARYAYAKDAVDALAVAEQFGFKLESSILKSWDGASNAWRDVTDGETTLITAFNVALVEQASIDLTVYCQPVGCSAAGCPALQIGGFEITLTGRAKSDANVVRTLREEVRIRNDRIQGACAS